MNVISFYCCLIKFPSPEQIILLLFSKAKKVGKNAFARLQPSEILSSLTVQRKEGIRIRNANLKWFYKPFKFSTFRNS